MEEFNAIKQYKDYIMIWTVFTVDHGSCPIMLAGEDREEERVLFRPGVGSKRNSLHFLGPFKTFNH